MQIFDSIIMSWVLPTRAPTASDPQGCFGEILSYVEKDFSSRRYLNRTCSVEVKETEVSTSGGAAHLAQSPKLCTRTYSQELFAIRADPGEEGVASFRGYDPLEIFRT